MEVPDKTFDDMNAGLAKMHAEVSAMGKKLDPEFRPDDGYPRTEPLAKAAMLGLCVNNTLATLAKSVDAALAKRDALAAELKESQEVIAYLKGENEHLIKGERPCIDCGVTGKLKDVDHKPCGGTGWLPKRAPAKA